LPFKPFKSENAILAAWVQKENVILDYDNTLILTEKPTHK